MTITKRRRNALRATAVAVPLALVVLGVVAWRDGGEQPVSDLTIAVPVPELGK